MPASIPLIFVDDDSSLRRVAAYNLKNAGYSASIASNGSEGWELFQSTGADLVVTDLAMPDLDGLELLKRIKNVSPDTEVIIVTAHGTIDRAVDAMRAGAFDFITKPFEFDVLKLTIERALEHRSLRLENERLKSELTDRFQPDTIIGVSSKMRAVFDIIARVTRSNANILILGESGTGKELVARAIHHSGDRQSGPFVAINCGALPRDLIESELFGVRRGAYTGADRDRPGRFERAEGGTLFLDEISELPIDLQVKLLRALQEREIERLGGTDTIPIDVRVICASNRNMEECVREGKLRSDLYYRINVVAIQVPPLRERPDDIEPLLREFLKRSSAPSISFTPTLLERLKQYSWPGNVRELENAVERAVVLRKHESRIAIEDLPDEVKLTNRVSGSSGTITPSLSVPEEGIDFTALEKRLLKDALRVASGNHSHAARLLGMSRQTFLYRLRKFGIDAR